MLSPAATANAVMLVGLLSPFVAMLIPNFRWLLGIFLVATAFIVVTVWIIGAAVHTEAAKPDENLDVLLGYAINFWTVVIGGSVFAASFAVKTWFHLRKAKQANPNPS
jgi:hypothetical protein